MWSSVSWAGVEKVFWDGLEPGFGRKETLLLALKVGTVNRYLVDGGLLDEIDRENEDQLRSLYYAVGIFEYLKGSKL